MPPCRLLALRLLAVFGLLSWIGAASGEARSEQAVDFGREVRPILAKHCLTCHGPDDAAREAGLRLDTAEGARQDLGGFQAVVPSDAEASELIARVSSEDADLRMPPADSHPPLSPSEIETLRRWIDSGATQETHWAFTPPQTPAIPNVADQDWCRGPIDRFVLSRIEAAGLAPASEADRPSLLRRLSLDLTGVVPTSGQVRRFVEDPSPDAYERVVDRLLASPEYAERFTRPWLDLARYSDTNGYEKDRPRTIWPYRDWVIDAIAADMPFNQFSIEQLAGDMLPEATAEQRIATGFHRNTMLNEEGGIDPLEYRYLAVVDRVATTGTVWLGLTTGCAQCHTHKYDPITHTDYFALFALLNGADEPELEVPDAAVALERQRITRRIEQLESDLADRLLPAWESFESTADPTSDPFFAFVDEQFRRSLDWRVLTPSQMESTLPKLTLLDDGSVLASGDVTKRDVYHLNFEIPQDLGPMTALRLEVLPHESLPAGGPGLAYYEGRRGDFFLSELALRFQDSEVPLEQASHSYGKISVGSGTADAANVIDGEGSTGWSTSGAEGQANRLVLNFGRPIEGPGTLRVEMTFERHFAAALGRFRVSLARSETGEIATASMLAENLAERIAEIRRGGESMDPQTYAELQRHFLWHAAEFAEHRKPIERLRRSLPEAVRTLVMQERLPDDRRVTQRHHRGEYLQPEDDVEAALPSMFVAPAAAPVRDRLALSRWLASEDNPLVARVTVNRAWRQFFGTGIVRTAGDFGTQSEPPSHEQLLDWLATDWMRQGWSMKRLHRQIVMSSTYRQSVGPAPPIDPDHRLLSSMPYRRLDAELIRDALLAASGLLSCEVGGESVHPPQPESVTGIAYSSPTWPTSSGSDRYRRSLYTFAKRTAPFAAYTTFDGPTGEVCLPRRERSTTPLQALTLLNDAMVLEFATGLAESVLREAPNGAPPETIIEQMFQRLLTRMPDESERQAVVRFHTRLTNRLAGSDANALDVWTLVARALMNTDEAITTP